MQVEFTTREFVFSHGREPRGTGSWGFEFEDSQDVWFAPNHMTFTQAKRAAVAEANRRAGPDGVRTTVKVCP